MSSVLFDVPGPKARTRHRIYAAVFVVVSLAALYWVIQKLRAEEVLTEEVFEATFTDNNIDFLIEGLVGTLQAAGLAILTSLAFGTVFVFARLSDRRWIRAPAVAIIELFRAIPLVLMIIIIWSAYAGTIGLLWSLVAGLTLYNGSVLAEVFRAGILAVPHGQSEAAYALGMRKSQVMSLILFPQAVKFMLPAIISQCVVILKDTSLGVVIVYAELVRNSRQVALFVDNGTVVVYGTAALVFIVINYTLSKIAEYLERRLSRRGVKPVDVSEVAAPTGAGVV
jgi:glutamate transport system permease protein